MLKQELRESELKTIKIKAKTHSNIAFIKYWGKKDEKLKIPANSSISMNLSNAYTITSVQLNNNLKADEVFIDGKKLKNTELSKISKYLDLIRSRSKIKTYALVESENNFPKGVGIASSASGFAALSLAASKAYELNLNEKELSILARIGSGSASRSIPNGFVEWTTGNTSDESYSYSLYPPEYWKICDLIAIVGEKNKLVSSSEGHAIASSSPFYNSRIAGMDNKVSEIKQAMKNKDFTKFGEIIEAEAINMHAVMMTSNPPIYYWLPETLKIMQALIGWRKQGLEAYFTIDAGPNIHVICESANSAKIKNKLKEIGVEKILDNKPSSGAKLI